MNMKYLLIKFSLLIVIGVLAVGLGSCSDNDFSLLSYGSGEISGVITDDYGAPLDGVVVSVEGTDKTTSTNTNGEYVLENIQIAKTILTFKKQDYLTMSVTVTPKSYVSNKALVNASMEYAAAKITGVVYDGKHNNVPLAGVNVSISDAVFVTTNSDGTYTIENLPLNSYNITFSYDGYESVNRIISVDDFVNGIANIDVNIGGKQILPSKTLEDLQNCDRWGFSEIRGGRNSENYPHFDWSTDFMATLDFYGQWEEQDEGTTLQIRNDEEGQNNPVDLNNFDSYVYGLKHITEDNKYMTIQCRTHNATSDDPTIWGVQVVDMSSSAPEAVKLGDNRSLSQEDYASEVFDLSDYIGKDVIIAIGIYRAKSGDYYKQLVLRRLSFNYQPVAENDWGWLVGTDINEEMVNWGLTREMVRSSMPQTVYHFTGISPQSGSRDDYGAAYHSWRDVSHIGALWSFVPLHKDTEPFASEGFVMKTNGSGTPCSLTEPQAYFYTKFFIQPGHNQLVLTCRNFEDANATYVKLTAVDNNMNVINIQPLSTSSADQWGIADHGSFWFIHNEGNSNNSAGYAHFTFDLSSLNGKDVTLILGVYKGTDNPNENKLSIYSVDLN